MRPSSISVVSALAFLLAACSTSLAAQADATPSPVFATGVDGLRLSPKLASGEHGPAAERLVALDEAALVRTLRELESRSLRGGGKSVELAFPGLAGERVFRLRPAAVMHRDLAARYPEIRAFEGYAADGSGERIRVEYSPARGWSTHVRGPGGVDYLVEAVDARALGGRRYVLRDRTRLRPSGAFACHADHPADELDFTAAQAARGFGDCQLRRYRLAVACTGEYARAVDGNSPTKAGVIAAMVVAVNRVNEVYERDLGVTFQLIANNDEVVYLNGTTDPFTEGSPGAMIDEVQTVIDNEIGSAGYDVGHIFSTQGGGLAQLATPCDDNNKARGVTGINPPLGDPFYIDYVAHEIGHQFGGTHTFYNSCNGNRTSSTAFEPGSGSTIMAYAGICSPNVQNRSDDYFHYASVFQIASVVTGFGGSCAQIVATNNTAPAINNATLSYTIPVSTAFELTAEVTDAEGDPLTYAWEQLDNDLGAPMPPQASSAEGPLFRSLAPSSSPTRRFPSGLYPDYEVLPSVPRALTFGLTVRDNNAAVGCTSDAILSVTTAGTEPFEVTNFNTAATLTGLEDYTVTWDVAGTDLAPVNTPQVDIYLSLDGGLTYAETIASAVANDGSHAFTLPNVATTQGRFVVKGHDNVFLDVNDADLVIQEAAVPTFTLSADPLSVAACDGADVTYALDVSSVLGFGGSVNLSAQSLPGGVTASFTANGAAAPYATTVTLTGLAVLAAGTYAFDVVAVSGGIQRTLELTLVRDNLPSVAPAVSAPADGASVGLVVTEFGWTYDAAEGEVRLQLSADPRFLSGVFEQDFAGPGVAATGLGAGVYYWRVAYVNDCGLGPWSALSSFRVLELEEDSFVSTGAVPIGTGAGATYTSTINVPRAGQVYRAELSLDVTHTYVGDLDGEVAFPRGLTFGLFARPGGGGCSSSDLDLVFADDAAQGPNDLVAQCNGASPAIVGSFRPIDLFYPELPREGSGDYTLTIRDNAFADGGAIDSWAMSLWYLVPDGLTISTSTDTVRVPEGGQRDVTSAQLTASEPTTTAAQTFFVVKARPARFQVVVNGVVLGTGDVFSQEQVDLGQVTFVHDGSPATATDELRVDVVLGGGGYVPNLAVPVRIVTNTLAATATVTSEIACFGDLTGGFVVNASGGAAPLSYSVNSGAFTGATVYDGLAAGTYEVTVRDADGFELALAPVTISQPTELTLDATASGAEVTAVGQGGTGALAYSLDGGAFQASGTFTGLPNGTYVLTVRDANGCEATDQVVVSVDALLVQLQVVEDIRCHGERATLEASAAGGTPPYTYSLNGAAAQAATLFTGIGAGTYSVVAIDDNGVQSAASATVTIVEPDPLTASAQVNGDDVLLSATGGTEPYSYSLDGVTFGSSGAFNGLANGAYDYVVRDANGCTDADQFTIAVNGVTLTVSTTDVSCAGSADGQIVAQASGGTPAYTYRLDGGSPQPSGLFSGLAAGTYEVSVVDADGFTRLQTVTVGGPDALTATASPDGNFVVVTATGGTPPYTFDGPGAQVATGRFGPLPEGTYTYDVTDANGCATTAQASIAPSDLALVVDLVTATVTCPGDSDGAVALAGSGGVPPYSYSVDGGASYQTSPNFSGLPPGTYTAAVRDDVGVVRTQTFTIADAVPLTGTLVVDGSFVELVDLAGVPAGVTASYSFDGGSTFGAEPSTYVYAAGAVQAIVRYGNCEQTFSAQVTDPLRVTASEAVLCPGDAEAAAQVCIEGGSGAVSFVASGATATVATAGAPCREALTVVVPAGGAGVAVSVTDATGATRDVTIAVITAAAFTPSVSVTGTSLTVAVVGGVGPFAYSLDGGATTQADPTFTDLPGGMGTVTVLDVYGCAQTVDYTVVGLDASARALGLRVYPNPARERLFLDYAAVPGARAVHLYDATGRRVLRQEAGPDRTEFTVGHLAPGVYAFVLQYRDGNARGTVVVQ